MRAELTQAVAADPSVDNLVALAEVCFIWGDIRAKTTDDKLAAYDQGRQAAQRAVELAPRSVTAHLWYAIDTGRWGQTKGIMRSLVLLPIVSKEIDTVLALDPKFPPAYSLAGHFYLEVPGMLGGDLDRAEKLFRTGLGLDPTFTACAWASPRRSSRRAASPKPGRSSTPSSPRRRPTISPTGRSRIPSRPGSCSTRSGAAPGG